MLAWQHAQKTKTFGMILDGVSQFFLVLTHREHGPFEKHCGTSGSLGWVAELEALRAL